MVLENTLFIKHSTVEMLNKALNWKDGDPMDDRFEEDETWTETVTFEDGIEADLKVCGVQYEGIHDEFPARNAAWSELVFFKNGSEIFVSDTSDEVLGVWEADINGKTYRLIVKELFDADDLDNYCQVGRTA